MAGGRLALDAGWLLVIVLVLGLGCAMGIAVRRTLIERGGGSVECGLRRVGERRWRLGLAAYQPDELRWYPVFGLRLRPGEFFARRALSVVSKRPADPVEMTSVGSGAVVVECSTGKPAERIELALTEDALTGFLAWLEAAPPGPVSDLR
ncbi:MAG TPA: DUF2550 domain-containing protein [Streptosporangiaceae bacterium]|nr:DUF2550 domain-containing protein [Streptosporangiaceae bacterium]